MTGYLDWKYIDERTTTSLEGIFDEAGVKQVLFDAFRVEEYPPQKRDILLDFYFQTYAFCKAAAFDSRQTSTLLSIMNEIFLYDAGANTLKNNVTESFQRFQVLLLKHSVERPPKSVQIFRPTDVEPVLEFALGSYFRNYNLYSYVFGKQTLLTIRQIGGGGVELPYVAMPLREAKEVYSPPPAHESASSDQQ